MTSQSDDTGANEPEDEVRDEGAESQDSAEPESPAADAETTGSKDTETPADAAETDSGESAKSDTDESTDEGSATRPIFVLRKKPVSLGEEAQREVKYADDLSDAINICRN